MEAARIRCRIKGTQLYASDLGTGESVQPAYEAAGRGRRLRTWVPSSAGPNAALQYNLSELRNRSRDLVRKNPYATRASDAFVSNVIGTGIRPLSKADDETFRETLQDLWRDWTEDADADGLLGFGGLEALIARAWYEGGECFIRRRVRRPEDGLAVPLQLQVLEGEHVPVEMDEIARNGNIIRHGIEFDRIGRRVAYHMYRVHPGDSNGLQILQRSDAAFGQTVRVPAAEVLHIYLPRRPGQQRGEPWLTRALVKLRDLDAYDDAELMRKKTAAMFVGFTKKVDEALQQLGDTDSHAEADEEDDVAVQTMEPGTVIPLEDGEDITFSKPEDVGGQYEPFMRQQLRAVAQAAGVLYEQLTGDYSQINDRTYRAAHNEMRRQVEALQQHVLVHQFCRPAWRWFWDLGRMAGAIRVPSALSERQARRVEWIAQGFRYIHPVQDVQAQRDAVRSGFKSRAAVVSEIGQDIHDVDREQTSDHEREDEAGLVYDSDPRKTSKAGGAQGLDAGFGRFEDGDDDDEDRPRQNGAAGPPAVN